MISKLFSAGGSGPSKRQRRNKRAAQRKLDRRRLFMQPLEPRLLLHGGDDHNGPHDGDPNYDPNAGGLHIHADLSIFVETQQVIIPDQVGDPTFIHTHLNESGTLHIHPSTPPGEFINLGDFFEIWATNPQTGSPDTIVLSDTQLFDNMVDANHRLQMFVNGSELHQGFDEYQIHDGDEIVLVYGENPVVNLNTNVGSIPLELFATPTNNPDLLRAGETGPVDTSGTVDNILSYLDEEFVNMFFHRSETGFVIQGGRFVTPTGNSADNGQVTAVAKGPTITNEPGLSNVRGTIALARRGGAVNSGSSEVYFNLADNTGLDTVDEGFTVFGQALDLTTVDAIAALGTTAFTTNVFEATLQGIREVPPVTTNAEGGAALSFDDSDGTFDINIFVEGIDQAELTDAHIHQGAFGANGPVIFDLGDGSQWTVEPGGLRRTITNAVFPNANVSDLFANGTYINIHTNDNPDGEIRGQLFRGSVTNAPVTADSQLVFLESIDGKGTLRGTKYNDLDGDGQRDAGEPGLAGVTIYLDENNNSMFDADEKSATTAADGSWFIHAPAGTHTVREELPQGFEQTEPQGPDSYTVVLGIGEQISGLDFGNHAVLVGFQLEITDANGDPIDTADVGDELMLNVFVEDLRPAGQDRGVATAFLDVNYDAALVSTVPITPLPPETFDFDITFGENFDDPDFTEGTDDGAGLIDEVGAVHETFGIGGTLGSGPFLLFSVKFTADEAGQASFTSAFADGQGHATSLAEPPNALSADEISFGSDTVTIISNETIANDDGFTVNEDTAGVVLGVLGNDNPPTGLTIQSFTAANQGGTVFFPVVNGQEDRSRLLYTPATDFVGMETFTYTAAGPNGTDTATVTVTVLEANDDPTANDDQRAVSEDSTDNVLDVLVNDDIAPDTGETLTISAVGQTDNGGTVTISADMMSLIYTPAADFAGTETFTYTIDDGNGGMDTATVTVNVIDDALDVAAIDDNPSVNEDTTDNTLNVLSNDFDEVGGGLTITGVGQTNNGGTVTISADMMSLIYSPAANFTGMETFTYTIENSNSDTSQATVTVTVNNVNDNPTADDDEFTVNEDSVDNRLFVLNGDTDAPDNGEVLRVAGVANISAGGTVTIDPVDQLSVLYTPAANFVGDETFTYTVSDGNGGTDTATVTVTVNNVNDNPDAGDDSPTVSEDSTNNTLSVLGNDTFAPDTGETLTITGVGTTPNGTVSIAGDQLSLVYTPDADFFGTDTFTYTISDGNGGSDTATVNVNVTNENDAPTANDDAGDDFRVTKNSGPHEFDVLQNDSSAPDPAETFTITGVTQGDNGGTVQITQAGQRVSYTPAQDFTGSETFTYTINDRTDGSGLTATATVTVEVLDFVPRDVELSIGPNPNNGNQPPMLIAGARINIGGNNVLGPVNQQVMTNSNGSFMVTGLSPGNYTAAIDVPVFLGGDSSPIPFVIPNDLNVNPQPIAVELPVLIRQPKFVGLGDLALSPANRTLLIAVDMTQDTAGGQQVWSSFEGNWDPNNLPENVELSFTGNNPFAPGTNFLLTVDGSQETFSSLDFSHIRYVGQEGHNLLVRITADWLSQGGGDNPGDSNASPVAQNDSYAIGENQALNINAAVGVLNNDTDADGDPLTANLVSQPGNGSVSLTQDGAFTYTPNTDFSGNDSFTYQANDGTAASDTATVSINVHAANTAPVAVDDAYAVSQGNTLTVDSAGGVLGNDSDADGDSMAAQQVAGPANGTLDLSADGAFTYDPDAGFVGTDSFTYQANDGVADSAVATVSIEVGVATDALPDFTLTDVNPLSASEGEGVSPREYLQQVSGWYFGHST